LIKSTTKIAPARSQSGTWEILIIIFLPRVKNIIIGLPQREDN